jgi:hypothetical protein
MNRPVDEIRRLREQLAAKDSQIAAQDARYAELAALVQQHLEATKDDHEVALQREHQAFERGQDVRPREYDEGFDIGHDVGLGADEDARPFVAGVREGFQAGREARQEVIDQLGLGKPRCEAEMEME